MIAFDALKTWHAVDCSLPKTLSAEEILWDKRQYLDELDKDTILWINKMKGYNKSFLLQERMVERNYIPIETRLFRLEEELKTLKEK